MENPQQNYFSSIEEEYEKHFEIFKKNLVSKFFKKDF